MKDRKEPDLENKGSGLDRRVPWHGRRTSRRVFVRSTLVGGGVLLASLYVKPSLQSIGATPAYAQATPTPTPGPEGCTPGFWKENANKHGASRWGPTGYSPSDDFDTVFGVSAYGVNNKNLLQALSPPPEMMPLDALAWHATAALLNAAHPDVAYPLTVSEVITRTRDAINSGDDATIQAQKDEFQTFNERFCPLPQD